MGYLPFAWLGTGSLEKQLATGLRRASLFTYISRPNSIVFWRSDGTGLRIRSKMHDIAERIEVGVLHFESAKTLDEDAISVNLHPAFNDRVRATKLTISESGTTAESGLMMEATNGDRIVIVAGVYPYTLAVKGLFEGPRMFEPEYPLEAYEPRGFLARCLFRSLPHCED